MTAPKATEVLRERQQVHPPWQGADRAAQILGLVRPGLIVPEINLRLFAGTLAVGEVGLAPPTASTSHLDDGSFVVEINSGLMHLMALVTRTLHAFSTEHSPGGIVKPALTHKQLVNRLGQIFLDWQGGQLGTLEGFRKASVTIDPKMARLAHALAVNAEIFVLAHELGHVVMDGGDREEYPPPAQWIGPETYADWLGLKVSLATGSRLGNVRLMYAGVLLAVRVFSFLGRFGQPFCGPHARPAERFGVVKRMARDLFGHDIQYTTASTIALAYDEALEGAENVLEGRPHDTEQTDERVRVRLWAMLEERLKEGISHERFIEDMKGAMSGVTPSICEAVAKSFREWFVDSAGASLPDPTGGRLPVMGGFLRVAIPHFPEPARTVFATQFPLSAG
jgi:hypothetical protein